MGQAQEEALETHLLFGATFGGDLPKWRPQTVQGSSRSPTPRTTGLTPRPMTKVPWCDSPLPDIPGRRSATPATAGSPVPDASHASDVQPRSARQWPSRQRSPRSQQARSPRDFIKVLVQLPGSACMAIWVRRMARVGPAPPAEAAWWTLKPGPEAGRVDCLKLLLQRRQEALDDQELPWMLRTAEPSLASLKDTQMSLKEVLEAATSIPVSQQRLVCKQRGPLNDNSRRLCDLSIGHESLLVLSMKPGAWMASACSQRERRPCLLASTSLAKVRDHQVILERVHKQGQASLKGMVETAPRWHAGHGS